MDFKSFYRKIDVDSFKNRLPPMPQIKIPKIKSRKIFKCSREDLAQQQPPVGGGAPMTPQSLPPPSAFIDRTPTRISTVSSLMDINYGFRDKHQSGLSTYRAASTFEEENCPDNGDAAAESGNAATRFGDKCKKTYKDLSEFKIKNIFAKKTVVKRTEIEVDIYARQYELELRQEQDELENQLVERGYEFEFKEARRRMSRSSGSISPPDSMASGVPSPIRSELGHLQRNNTPPMLARRRNAIDEAGPSRFHFHRSMSDESAGKPPKKPNRSSLWGLNESSAGDEYSSTLPSSYRTGICKLGAFRKSKKEGSTGTPSAPAESVWKMKSIRARFASEDSGTERKAKKSMHQQESMEEPTEPAEPTHEKKRWTLRSMNLRNSEAEKSSEPHMSSPEGKFSSIKQSIKRMKERKSQRENSEESEHEQTEAPTKSNVSTQLKAGLRRLKLRERSFTFDEEETQPPQPATNKLRDWKKSFKTKRPSESAATDEEAPARAAPHGRSSTLMRKLHHIRSKKVGSEDGDESGDPAPTDDQHKPKSSNMEKLEHAREKAMKKMNAQVQKMKMFHAKSRDSPTESSPEKPPRRAHKCNSDEQEDAAIAEIPRSTQTSWTTNKAISQSLDSDDEVEIPRVLIHQDNTDQYESTLIIAVTRPAPPVPKSTAIIKEITPRVKSRPRSEWIPNKNAISTFLEMTPSPPPCPQQLEISRGHARKRSMDSNDSDSWIPDNFRTKSCTSSTAAGLDKISESTEPWKVHSVFSEKRLYKANSIDIFAHRDGGAFVDFDDELKNVPVRRIAAASADSIEKSFGESTDDDDDYDNASRITRVKQPEEVASTKVAVEAVRRESIKGSVESTKACHGSPPPAKKGQIGNSQESLDANYDENEELSSDDDDEPPNEAPSPPPSFSPPPPPLPLRKPPRMAPERNDSMVRLAHPLVKQASFRRHFSEEIEPSDLGKVNKLICRFEKTPSEESVERVQTIPDDNEDDFETEDAKTIKAKDNVSGNGNKKRPAPIPKIPDTIKVEDLCNNNEIQVAREDAASPEILFHKNLDNVSIQSPNSEYGSPIGSMCFSERISTSSEYGSPIGMAYSNRTLDQLHAGRRLSNRSSLRDDDTFYSFESDEENNFYSLGESSSTTMRYTIEI